MPKIKLSDGKLIDFETNVNGLQISEKISKSLFEQAMVMSVDGELKDLTSEINKDSEIKIFTAKDKEGLEVLRHDTAHILAMAVQELYPGTEVAIGPVIENGFYYDFSRKDPFTEDDLKKIELRKKASDFVDNYNRKAKFRRGIGSLRNRGIKATWKRVYSHFYSKLVGYTNT